MFDKLKNIQLNLFQHMAVLGFVFSAASQVGLRIAHKQIDSFWAVYIVWAVVLILASVIKIDMPDDHQDLE
jgi:hypothetical protein